VPVPFGKSFGTQAWFSAKADKDFTNGKPGSEAWLIFGLLYRWGIISKKRVLYRRKAVVYPLRDV
jgi:hypothetical protein